MYCFFIISMYFISHVFNFLFLFPFYLVISFSFNNIFWGINHWELWVERQVCYSCAANLFVGYLYPVSFVPVQLCNQLTHWSIQASVNLEFLLQIVWFNFDWPCYPMMGLNVSSSMILKTVTTSVILQLLLRSLITCSNKSSSHFVSLLFTIVWSCAL